MKEGANQELRHYRSIHTRVAIGLLPALLAGSPTLGQGPPANKTYFILQVGFAGPYSWTADCATFSRTEFCTLGGGCGQWYPTSSQGSDGTFAIDVDFQDWEIPVHAEGEATIDDLGRSHSFAGAGFYSTSGRVGNFGFSARPVGRRRCFRLLGEWDLQHKNPNCVALIEPGDPESSQYILPFAVGTRTRIKQSYCMEFESHANAFAYDFELPIGTEIVASRAGIVHAVEVTLPDDPFSRDFNSIIIEHDGARSTYDHIMQGGALVEVGDTVEQGQAIALSGLSGTEYVPIIHFEVQESLGNGVVGERLWVEFRNVGGRLDERGGLMRGFKYRALPIN